MSGTRFARAGRWRLFMCLGALILMLGMIALFHNQQELDEKRDQRLRTLNEQLQSIIEQKYQLERNHENERLEQIESRHNLEQKLKGIEEQETKEQLRYEKLLQAQKSLQSKYNELEGECNKNKKEQLKHKNALEQDLQNSRSELQKLKNSQIDEIKMWQEKYNAEKARLEVLTNAADAKGHLLERINKLEQTLAQCQSECNLKAEEQQPLQQIKKPPHLVNETRTVKSFSAQVAVSPGLYEIAVKETNKTQLGVDTNTLNATILPTAELNANNIKATAGGLEALGVGDGLGVGVGILSVGDVAAAAALTKPKTTDRSLILMSVENFQILPKSIKKLSDETETQLQQQPEENNVIGRKMASPLSAPRKPSSTKATKSEQHMLESNVGALQKKSTNSSGISSTSSSLAPLQLPPNQRKIPANVAPIPANFDELIKNDINSHDGEKSQQKVVGGDVADIDAAMEDIQKHDNNHNDANNNRYANAVNDMESHAHNGEKAIAGNEDSGAHEIKDHDFGNEQNFNLGSVGAGAGALIGAAGPADDGDGSFFDGAAAVGAGAGAGKHHEENDVDDVRVKNKIEDNEDDDMLGVGGADTGDIAVKSNDHLLDGENLNNEVAGDQGKEFAGDGLRLEDGNEEDEDEDDYSNLAARQQGAQAIRN